MDGPNVSKHHTQTLSKAKFIKPFTSTYHDQNLPISPMWSIEVVVIEQNEI